MVRSYWGTGARRKQRRQEEHAGNGSVVEGTQARGRSARVSSPQEMGGKKSSGILHFWLNSIGIIS